MNTFSLSGSSLKTGGLKWTRTTDLMNTKCSLIRRCAFARAQHSIEAYCFWWAQVDSNHRPRAYQARALTT